ncbi:MAG: TonB-dependent receptor [Amphiplicatus sp.]
MKFRAVLAISAAAAAFADCGAVQAWAADEIVVRARKQQESIQDVPISITAFSGSDLDARGVTSLEDIAFITPNMTTTGGSDGANSFSIRGLSSTSNNPGIESGIGLYVDEVYIGKSYAFMTALSDIESVEVLRGPQGTLYGRNTIGGAINIFTREPGEDANVNADFTYGNYGQYQVRGSVSGPLVEGRAYASLSAVVRQRDGYLKDFARDTAYQDEDLWGARGKLLLNLGADTQALLIGDYYIDKSVDGIEDIREGALAPLDPFPLEERKVGTNFASYSERESYGVSGKVTHDLGGAELVAITSYRAQRIDSLSDQDFSVADISYTGRAQDQNQFSQEIRVVSDKDGRFSYIIGGYFLSEDVDAVTTANLGLDAIGTVETSYTFADVSTEAYAVFASATYRFNDYLEASGGVRYSYEDKTLAFSQTLSPGAFIMPLAGISIEVPLFIDDYSQGAVSGDASLNFKPADDVMLYASFARGFKAGGFNATLTSMPPAALAFDAEFVNSYEAGLKTSFFDDALRINLAGFYLDYSDKQEQTRVGTFFQVQNAAKATSKGFELEVFASPHPQIQFTGGLGYVDAEYDSYPDCDPFGADCSGNTLQNAPELTANAAARVDQPVGNGLNLFALAQMTYADEAFVFVDNDPQFVQESRTLVNLRAGIEGGDGRWAVEGWVTNLTDETAIEFSQEFLGTVYSYINEPRMYGATVRVNF